MSYILTTIGMLLLLVSLAGIAFGLYMATHPRTRRAGKLFAICWVPIIAAAWGILMRDTVTFAVGLICFLVAGGALILEGDMNKPAAKRKSSGEGRPASTRNTRTKKTKGYRRAAS